MTYFYHFLLIIIETFDNYCNNANVNKPHRVDIILFFGYFFKKLLIKSINHGLWMDKLQWIKEESIQKK